MHPDIQKAIDAFKANQHKELSLLKIVELTDEEDKELNKLDNLSTLLLKQGV